MSPFLDVVIGGSIRAAVVSLKQYNASEKQDTMRVFSRSFDAPRRMEEKEIIQVFHLIGSCDNLMRLEIGSQAESRRYLELPALAIAQCLMQSSSRGFLKDLLLSRVRVSGSWSDMCILTDAMMNHKSMNRLYIADCHPISRSSPMVQFLRAAATNPHMESLVVRDVDWAGEALSPMDHKSSRLKSIRVRGAQCLGPVEWVQFIDNLRFNGALKELRITACALCPGMGLTIGRVLAAHQVLEDVVLEFREIEDTAPIGWALATNTILQRVDLLVYSPGPDMKRRLITSMFADIMSRNYSVSYLCLRSSTYWLSSPLLDFYLRLNRCGNRRNLVCSEIPLPAKEWVDTIIDNKNDLSVVYYLLQLNPSLCHNVPKERASRKASFSRRSRTGKRKRPDDSRITL